MADLPLDEGVIEADVLEEVDDVGPAQGMDVQAPGGSRVRRCSRVKRRCRLDLGTGSPLAVGKISDTAGASQGSPFRIQVSRTAGDQSETVSTERLLGGEPRFALPYLTCRIPNSPNCGALRFREKSTVCRCVTSLARSPHA